MLLIHLHCTTQAQRDSSRIKISLKSLPDPARPVVTQTNLAFELGDEFFRNSLLDLILISLTTKRVTWICVMRSHGSKPFAYNRVTVSPEE